MPMGRGPPLTKERPGSRPLERPSRGNQQEELDFVEGLRFWRPGLAQQDPRSPDSFSRVSLKDLRAYPYRYW